MQTVQQNTDANSRSNNYIWILNFIDNDKKIRALTNKVQALEHIQKFNTPYPQGINEEWTIIGHQLLDFYFVDFMLKSGQKINEVLVNKQKALADKNLCDLAIIYKINEEVLVGKQVLLKNNPKVLAETFKALIAGQYIDKGYDLEYMRQNLIACYKFLLKQVQVAVPVSNSTNSTNFKSKFFDLLNEHKLIPKLSLEWRRSDNETLYTTVLEIQALQYKHSVEGNNKRQTEEVLFEHFLNMFNNSKLSTLLYSKILPADLNQSTNDSMIGHLEPGLNQSVNQESLVKSKYKQQVNAEFNMDAQLEELLE